MPSVSVLIYTYNSEDHIGDCIDSAHLLTNDVIIVDQKSTDKTSETARKKKAEIVSASHHQFVEPVRMIGIKHVKTDWFVILDADERLTTELAKEIKEKIGDINSKFTSYRIPRKNIFARKKWLRYGGWYPDYQIRCIKTNALEDWPGKIHAMPIIKGDQGTIDNPITHYFHGDIEGMAKKTVVFEQIEAGLLYEAKRKSSSRIFFRKFLGELYRRLLVHYGWKDGMIGIIECFYQAYSKTITYLFLYEKQQA